MTPDPRIDAYIDRQADFARPILRHLRETLHAADVGANETIKWNMPFFELNGRPFANMAAFKAHASFGFWKRRRAGTGREDEAMGQFGRLTTIADLPARDVLLAMIRDAATQAGLEPVARTPSAPKAEAEVPPDLADALAEDAVAAATFAAFPPGCRREYCEWVDEAKRPETRSKRIAQTLALLREGKRRYWKYQAC